MMKDTAPSRHGMYIAMAAIALLFTANSPAATPDGAKHKAGDCVEYDTTNALDPAARWRRGQITKNDGYFYTIVLEARGGGEPEITTVAVASAHKWLRQASGCAKNKVGHAERPDIGAPAKEPPRTQRRAEAAGKASGECPFNKDYRKVSSSAPASAELFKGVIFEWEYSLNQRYQDFGLTFLDFQMGRPFENRVYPGINASKDVDAAPAGATIYPVKAKELICQKDISITLRWVWEIEYGCFKDKFGAWVCMNKAPKQLEHTSIPN